MFYKPFNIIECDSMQIRFERIRMSCCCSLATLHAHRQFLPLWPRNVCFFFVCCFFFDCLFTLAEEWSAVVDAMLWFVIFVGNSRHPESIWSPRDFAEFLLWPMENFYHFDWRRCAVGERWAARCAGCGTNRDRDGERKWPRIRWQYIVRWMIGINNDVFIFLWVFFRSCTTPNSEEFRMNFILLYFFIFIAKVQSHFLRTKVRFIFSKPIPVVAISLPGATVQTFYNEYVWDISFDYCVRQTHIYSSIETNVKTNSL